MDVFITVKTPNGLKLRAHILRESNPRLVSCQDRIAEIDSDNNIVKSVDLLELFPVNNWFAMTGIALPKGNSAHF